MVHLMRHKSNSELIGWLREHPRLKNERFWSKPDVVYRATAWRLRDRLTERDIVRLIVAFQTGMATKELATRFNINVKSVRKLLRENGGQRSLDWVTSKSAA